MKKKRTRNIKKKHDNIVNDYDKQKSKHLEKLATKILKQKDIEDQLRNKPINRDFLDLF